MSLFRPSFLRELMLLSKTAEQEFHGQLKIFPSDGLDMNTFTVEIVPEKGLYAHASFLFRISVTDQYPNTSPLVTCLTPVFHPNIEMGMARDNVCLNIFQYWERHFGIKDLLHALLFLLYEPNFNDPYNLYCTDLPNTMSIEQCIRHTLAGGVINSVRFPPNEAWCQWASENGLLPSTSSSVAQSTQIPTTMITNGGTHQPKPPMEHQQSMTNGYFRRSLSGQFTPALLDAQDSAEWSHAIPNEGILPFGFLCHITVETLNNVNINLTLPWSNFSRYYFAEACSLDHVEFIWESVAASVGSDHPERAGEQLSTLGPQRSTVAPWTLTVNTDTTAVMNSELNNVEVLEQMLAALVLDGQNEHNDDGNLDATQPNLEMDSWNRTEASWRDSGPDSTLHDNSNSVAPNEDFSASNTKWDVFEPEGRISGAEFPSNDACAPLSSGDNRLPSDHSATTLHDKSIAMADQQSKTTNGPDKPPVSTGCDNDSTALDDDRPDKEMSEQFVPEPKNHRFDMQSTGDGADLEEGNSAISNDEISDQHAHQSLQIAFSSEEFDLLPVDIQALLQEPTLDLSFLYPVVDWYGSSDWHIHPRQFEFVRRLLLTLQPAFWIYYQTRWPPFLAPGRGTTITPSHCLLRMEDDCRASSSQLRCDLLQYCCRIGQANSTLLVDPLAVSPWSPILNYVVFSFPLPSNPSVVSIRSVQWMSWSQSIYLPLHLEYQHNPPRLWSFLLASTCILCNFLCYFSRMELYGTSLGYSRRTHYSVIDSFASICLTPATLGCGQCSVFDAWPLWMVSRGLRFVCSLLWRLGSRGAHSSNIQSRIRPAMWFPFTDLDEI